VRYAAFLRAINVGKHNRIRMADLRMLCLEAGLRDVSTYLQTGNILFDFDGAHEAAGATIETALAAHGLRNAPAAVRSLEDLDALLDASPFGAYPVETFTRFVTLFRNALPPGVPRLPEEGAVNIVAVREREILTAVPVHRPRGVDVNGALSKAVRLEGTTRYWHVVEEVARLLAQASGK
jgi:uncharacterized protein (DUF1697 family)